MAAPSPSVFPFLRETIFQLPSGAGISGFGRNRELYCQRNSFSAAKKLTSIHASRISSCGQVAASGRPSL